MPRPKIKDELKRLKKSVTLPPDVAEELTALGDGNLSAGIEKSFRGYQYFRASQGIAPLSPMKHEPPNVSKTKKKTTKKAR